MPAVLKFFLSLSVALVIFQSFVCAHQPRIPTDTKTVVVEPEISKAYYSALRGQAHTYSIASEKPFDLYVNILVPDIEGAKKDISAVVFKAGAVVTQLAVLDGPRGEWKKFFEPYARDMYWRGPEFKIRADAGNYEIRVWSQNNDSKYVLVTGADESFGWREIINALKLLPTLKHDFFGKSPVSFALSVFGMGYLALLFVFALLQLFLCLIIVRFVCSRRRVKKVDMQWRLVSAFLGIGLLAWTLSTSWNPLLIVLAGFLMLRAVFGCCYFFA